MKDPWASLRSFTQARIAQGQCGSGLPTEALLDFQLSHAAARDAVLKPWCPQTSAASLEEIGRQHLILTTKVLTREQYLLRPDEGRSLSNESRDLLKSMVLPPVDIALILTNSVILVGERPGLSAADSVGAYLTFGPRVGRTDAERNCISNIRPPDGLSFEEAAIKMVYLCREGLRRGLTGVQLKDDMPVNIAHLESP
ncbi:MAG: ethanolamine ammonia-lyase [Gammaproteobacteria bacterium]|nr:ethanolamine ammonia-lyase [Gammaproteobacteria bacterium]